MPESNNQNQNDNLSAFDAILKKYSDLLIELEQLRSDNKTLKKTLSSSTLSLPDKGRPLEPYFLPDAVIAEIKQDLTQIKLSVNAMVNSQKEHTPNSQKRKRKSSKKSKWQQFKKTIGIKTQRNKT